MEFLSLLLSGCLLYLLGLLVAFIINKDNIKQFVPELITSGIIFTIIFAIALQFSLTIAYGDDFINSLWYIPIIFVILKSYDYLIQPYIFLYFRRDHITTDFDDALEDAQIKAKVVVVKNLNNAYASGLLPNLDVIVIGANLISSMDNISVKGILFHEIAHIKSKHLFIMLLIDLFVFYLFVALSYLLFVYCPDSLLIRVISFGMLGASIPFLQTIMRQFELKADLYAANMIGKLQYIDALQALNQLSGMKMEKFDIAHPKLSSRIKNILNAK